MLHLRNNKFFIYIILSVVLFTIALLVEKKSVDFFNHGIKTTEKVEKTISNKENEINSFLENIVTSLSDNNKSLHIPLHFEKLASNAPDYFTFFISKDDSLVFWSDNQVSFSRTLINESNNKLIHHKNGWYLNYNKQSDGYNIYGLYLIKHAYPFQNKYLQNRFNPELKIPANFKLIKTENSNNKNALTVHDKNNSALFTISYSKELSPESIKMIRLLYYLSLVSFALFLLFMLKFVRKLKWWQIIATIFSLLVLRYISIIFKFPKAIYSSELFSPAHYASSYLLNSLGDLLINTLLATYIIIFLYQVWRYTKITKSIKKYKIWLSINVMVMFCLTFMFTAIVHYLMASLVLNSNISYNSSNIFELSGYSIVGFTIIAMLLFSVYLLCDDVIRLLQKTAFSQSYLIILYIISIAIFGLLSLVFKNTYVFKAYSFAPFMLTNIVLLFVFLTRKVSLHRISYTRTLTSIFIFALFTSYTLNKYIQIKERETRKVFASKLSNEQDLIAEYLFSDVVEHARKDKFISAFFDSYNKKVQSGNALEIVVSKRLLQLYFTGYWNKYDIVFHCYDKSDLNISSQTLSNKNRPYSFFQEYILDSIPIAGSELFHFINDKKTRLSYLGYIPINTENNNKAGTVVIELKSKYLKSSPGFPDLLLTKNIARDPQERYYSYASYTDNKMGFQNGEYPYLYSSDQYELEHGLKTESILYTNENGYSHLYYKPINSALIIVSKPLNNILDLITPFSYLFTFFCLLFFVIYFIIIVVRSRFKIHFNLKNRIQISIMSIIILSIAILGGGTIYYIIESYSKNQNSKVAQQVSGLTQVIESELKLAQSNQSRVQNDLQSILSLLSTNSESDFNYFNRSGRLVFSTQPNIFEKNILSSLINPKAYNELEYKSGSRFMHNESAGSLKFMSAYQPIKGTDEEVIGYINYPYFAKENELKREISTFLIALINIYVLLFSIAVLVTFFVANRITQPLRLIQRKLANIRLGKRNELITWNKNDEIGLLVGEYNRMVEELAVSVEMLSISERESAWREMAKQVAHEIKNPLTPMKLSLQHLQRAYDDKRPNMDETIKKISKTIIEQIDTLSNIATEFSNFAKMPKAKNTTVDLNEIINNAVHLFDRANGVELKYKTSELENIYVYADKDHMNRVFSNLIKNAIQSIPEDRNGIVQINVALNGGKFYRISIKDNGIGIPPDKRQDIFRPNFTTKTAGTGLGLAMSKNIIETSGGKIWFETEKNTGTTFYVELPIH